MDSKEFWETAEVDVEMPTRTIRLELEEVYQHFAERMYKQIERQIHANLEEFKDGIIEGITGEPKDTTT